MAQFVKGDTIYFTAVGKLVNEGIVEAIEGPYIKIKASGCGPEYVMASQAFPTKEELRQSKAYHSAWFAQHQRMNMRQHTTRMASFPMF